ncbi:MAG: AraC family transcriptional regulator [Bacilli bacterium]|nr:AraC family transcriptional regulator [Bacilli bacterium]
MNIYQGLNEITRYIDNHLEEEISYEVLSKIVGVNSYTLQRLFTMIAGITLSDYIRKRRLSKAGYDLYMKQEKVMDVAIKYGYENATSFSRAFEKYHGIKPSLVSHETKLKNFPRIVFPEDIFFTTDLNYEIIELNEMHLYGLGISTSEETIHTDAPSFFRKTEDTYLEAYGKVKFGMITYDLDREESQKYYCLYDQEISGFERIVIPKSKWLLFHLDSQEPQKIQALSSKFYKEFLPSTSYQLRELPELEYYHDGMTDFLVAIE